MVTGYIDDLAKNAQNHHMSTAIQPARSIKNGSFASLQHVRPEVLAAVIKDTIRYIYPQSLITEQEESRGYFGDVDIKVRYDKNVIQWVEVNGRKIVPRHDLYSENGSC